MATDYLHGYDRDEQEKLDRQAELTYGVTKDFLNIKNTKEFNMIEIGCGTGYTLYRFQSPSIENRNLSRVEPSANDIVITRELMTIWKNCSSVSD